MAEMKEKEKWIMEGEVNGREEGEREVDYASGN